MPYARSAPTRSLLSPVPTTKLAGWKRAAAREPKLGSLFLSPASLLQTTGRSRPAPSSEQLEMIASRRLFGGGRLHSRRCGEACDACVFKTREILATRAEFTEQE